MGALESYCDLYTYLQEYQFLGIFGFKIKIFDVDEFLPVDEQKTVVDFYGFDGQFQIIYC